MNETDKNTALSLYEKIIDDAQDEQSALMKLVSPTRQAVNIARAYDANKRKEAIEALEEGQIEQICPEFAQAIIKIGCDITGNQDFPNDRIIEMPEDEIANEAVETIYDLERKVFSDIDIIEEKSEPKESIVSHEINEKPEKNFNDIIKKSRDIYEDLDSDSSIGATVEAYKVETATDVQHDDEKLTASISNATDDKVSDDEFKKKKEQQVDDFIKNMEVRKEPSYSDSFSAEGNDDSILDLISMTEDEKVVEEVKEEKNETEPKNAKVGKLLLFILCAVPICALIILALLVASVACFAIAYAIGKVAILGIASAFGSYAVFADILAVIGTSVVILALSILFTWIGIWIIAGVIVGLVKKAFSLANKWCYKEAVKE